MATSNYHPALPALITTMSVTVSGILVCGGGGIVRYLPLRAVVQRGETWWARQGKLRTCQTESPLRWKHRDEETEERKPSGDHFHFIYFHAAYAGWYQLIPVPTLVTLSLKGARTNTQIIWRKPQAVLRAVSHRLFHFIESRLLLY